MRSLSDSNESAPIRIRRNGRRRPLFSAVSLMVGLQVATVSVSVSALQPAKPQSPSLPRTSFTSLDYVVSPERTTTRSSSSKVPKKKQYKTSSTETWDQIYATPVTTAANNNNKRRTILRTAAGPKITKRKTTGSLSEREQLESAYQLRANSQALLTRDQEILYTERIHALRQAESIRALHAVNGTTMESQWATACGFANKGQLRRVLEQGQDARLQLVQANMGLVTSIAKRHYTALKKALEAGQGVGSCLTLQDCLQEGQLGLMEAAERFDPQRGVRFGTYATWWIRQRILKSITDSSRMIRLPAHVHQTLQKIKKAKIQMTQEIGREPSAPELAHYLEMPIAKLQQYTQVTRNVISLENPLQKGRSLGSSGGSSATMADSSAVLGDMIASDSPTPQEHVQQQMLRQDLQQVLLEVLTETERHVVLARFGLDDGSPKSIQETANVLGISRDRVRLVETKALNKLRRSPQKNVRLKTYVSNSFDRTGVSRRVKNNKSIPHTTYGSDNNHNIYNHHSHSQSSSSSSSSSQRVNPFASSPLEYTPKARAAVRVVHNTDRVAASASASAVIEEMGDEQRQVQEEQHPMYRNLPPAPAPDRMWFF